MSNIKRQAVNGRHYITIEEAGFNNIHDGWEAVHNLEVALKDRVEEKEIADAIWLFVSLVTNYFAKDVS